MLNHDWTWIVIYDDGSEFTEAQAAELGGWCAVEMPRVESLAVLPTTEGAAHHFIVPIRDGMRPIFFRRSRELNLNDPNMPIPDYYVQADGSLATKVHFATCFGWQQTVNGRNVKSLTWLFPDGSIAVTDRDIDELGAN